MIFWGCFFSPSLVGESSLSLLFKFMDISIGSMVWLSFVVNDCCVAVVDCFVVVVVGFVVVVVVDSVVKIVASVVLFSVVAGFLGEFFFPPLFSCDLRPPFLIFFRIFLLVLGSLCGCYCCYDR